MEIYLKPADLVDFFYDHYSALKESMVEIAADTDSGIHIYVTEYDFSPYIIVKDGDTTIDEILCEDFNEEAILKKCYEDYLCYDSGEDEEPEEAETQENDTQSAINEREVSLTDAWYDFLTVVFDEYPEVFDDKDNLASFEEAMDDTLGILATYGFTIYRPMFIKLDDGNEEYEEYPYN